MKEVFSTGENILNVSGKMTVTKIRLQKNKEPKKIEIISWHFKLITWSVNQLLYVNVMLSGCLWAMLMMHNCVLKICQYQEECMFFPNKWKASISKHSFMADLQYFARHSAQSSLQSYMFYRSSVILFSHVAQPFICSQNQDQTRRQI